MIGEVVKRVAEDLDRRIVEQELGDPFLGNRNYRPYPLNSKYLTPIRRVAFFIGGILGMGVGAIIFTATGRSMAVSAIRKGGNLAESTVTSWLKTGEQKK